MIHHQTMTCTMQTIEEAELLAGAAQPIAWRQQDALCDGHPDPRVEVPLQDSVIAARLIAVVTLRQQTRCRRGRGSNGIAQCVSERVTEQHQRRVAVYDT